MYLYVCVFVFYVLMCLCVYVFMCLFFMCYAFVFFFIVFFLQCAEGSKGLLLIVNNEIGFSEDNISAVSTL